MSKMSINEAKLINNLKDGRMTGGLESFLKQNGSTISMFAGFATLGLCIWRAYKASAEVAATNITYENKCEEIRQNDEYSEETKKTKLKEIRSARNVRILLAYKWVCLFGGATLGFMLLSQYLNGIAFTALAGYAMKEEDKVKELVKKGKEVIGEEKFADIQNAIIEENIEKNNSKTVIAKLNTPNDHGIMLVESYNGLLCEFDSLEAASKAIDETEEYYERNHGLKYLTFLKKLGYRQEDPPFDIDDYAETGWDADNKFEAKLAMVNFKGANMMAIMLTNEPKLMKPISGKKP